MKVKFKREHTLAAHVVGTDFGRRTLNAESVAPLGLPPAPWLNPGILHTNYIQSVREQRADTQGERASISMIMYLYKPVNQCSPSSRHDALCPSVIAGLDCPPPCTLAPCRGRTNTTDSTSFASRGSKLDGPTDCQNSTFMYKLFFKLCIIKLHKLLYHKRFFLLAFEPHCDIASGSKES